MTDNPLEIVFRDDYYVAVNKPPDLMVHRSPLAPRDERFVLQLLRDLLGRHVYPVHRLDRPTSGVLVFGLSAEAAQLLAKEFSERRVTKTYLAVVRGCTEVEGVIDHPLADPTERYSPVRQTGEEKEAVTAYRRLATVELPCAVGRYPTSRYSLVAARPLTGRRHQLRRHFKHLFHPIIGDTSYGEGRHNRFFRETFGCARLLLHAAGLSFRHPYTGEEITVAAGPGEEFTSVVERLGWGEALALPPWQ